MARSLGQNPDEIFREWPAPMVLEMFEYAEAKDILGYLHMKQPGDKQGVETIKTGLDDMREVFLLPLEQDERKQAHGETIMNSLMQWGFVDPIMVAAAKGATVES